MFHPNPTVCPTSKRCCRGTNVKEIIAVGPNTMTDLEYTGKKAYFTFSYTSAGERPSRIPFVLQNSPTTKGPQSAWSRKTRVAMAVDQRGRAERGSVAVKPSGRQAVRSS